ncbi:unnamed protein product, partial [Tetraodon nigroviridis]
MAALLRGLRAGRALRGLGSVTRLQRRSRRTNLESHLTISLHGACWRIGRNTDVDEPSSRLPETRLPCAAARLKDESTSDTSGYRQHNQAHAAKQDPATASQDGPHLTRPLKKLPEPTPVSRIRMASRTRSMKRKNSFRLVSWTPPWSSSPLHGWSAEAIAAGAETLGLSSASTGMFSNGAGDLVLHFITQCNSKLTEILAEQHKQIQLGQTEPKKTADFLRDAVETRLRMYIPYIDSWPQAMSILLLPHNIPDSLKHLSNLVDDIWYYAGDRSTDMNWYTKRAALTGIYNTTELVMLQDSSPDFQDTWNFLDNRIQDVVNMASTVKQAQSTGEAVVQGLMGAAVTLKNLTGMNQRR